MDYFLFIGIFPFKLCVVLKRIVFLENYLVNNTKRIIFIVRFVLL